MSDEQLRTFGKAAKYMISPTANMGKPPLPTFILQLEEARAEWRRKHPGAEALSAACRIYSLALNIRQRLAGSDFAAAVTGKLGVPTNGAKPPTNKSPNNLDTSRPASILKSAFAATTDGKSICSS
jgi:hypothetical protein